MNHGGSGTAVTAVPNTGYHFVSWSDGVLTAARDRYQRHGELTVTATFAINTYTLTYTAGANGTISGDQPADGEPRRQRHGGHGSRPTPATTS